MHLLNIPAIIICIILFPVLLLAQQKADTLLKGISADTGGKIKDTTITKDTVPEKDLSDVILSVFKKHSSRDTIHNTVTSKPVFSVVAAVGYTLQTKLAATIQVMQHFDQIRQSYPL